MGAAVAMKHSAERMSGVSKTVGHAGLYGVRWQAKRDAALAWEARFRMDTGQTQAKAASRFACRRTPYGCGRYS